jgi:hypothetical protein
MAYIFDEEIPRAPLRAMTPDERAQYALGFIELVAMPYGRNHDNNRDLETAVNSLVDTIAYACSKQMTQQENLGFHAYIRRLEQYHN